MTLKICLGSFCFAFVSGCLSFVCLFSCLFFNRSSILSLFYFCSGAFRMYPLHIFKMSHIFMTLRLIFSFNHYYIVLGNFENLSRHATQQTPYVLHSCSKFPHAENPLHSFVVLSFSSGNEKW